ncbi:MAG: hypothetical protein P1P65_04770 [Treponema sp.]
MFENVLGQPAVRLLCDEIRHKTFPPAVLFAGPEASGKLTAALEAARVLSCTEDGEWMCTCESCRHQKELAASDVLILGARDTLLETRAAARSFREAQTPAARYLFTRSVRKLTARFDARLWDTDEARFLKAAPILADIEEELSDLIALHTAHQLCEQQKLEKRTEKITALCEKLQEECMYDTIPVNQVRKASAWVRLIPAGEKKVLIIENADKLQESARNALLKVLEEPPEYAVFILTTSRRSAIMPTILSRVRTYTFIERDSKDQQAVIERVFRDSLFCSTLPPNSPVRIAAYLQSFLPVSQMQIREAAALFWQYCVFRRKQSGRSVPAILAETVSAGAAPHAELGSNAAGTILKLLNNGKPRRIYLLFLEAVLSFLQESLRRGSCLPLELEQYAAVSQFVLSAVQSVEIFNASPQAALETLAEDIMSV